MITKCCFKDALKLQGVYVDYSVLVKGILASFEIHGTKMLKYNNI